MLYHYCNNECHYSKILLNVKNLSQQKIAINLINKTIMWLKIFQKVEWKYLSLFSIQVLDPWN